MPPVHQLIRNHCEGPEYHLDVEQDRVEARVVILDGDVVEWQHEGYREGCDLREEAKNWNQLG